MTVEAVVGSPISFAVSGPVGTPLSDTVIYLNGAVSSITPTVTQIGVTNCWKITFTPTSTGVYSIYAFASIQLQIQSVAKSTQELLSNIEDECLGSWTWDKSTNVLTVLRQNGTTMATYDIVDTQIVSSRERLS